jgi:uncharacterized protein YceH (UPF0502 family)
MDLDDVERRILGSLLEKERTVPATYPLTLNALRTACNQTSGRDPVMDVAEYEIAAAIDRLKAQGLARIVHAGTGARATKYRQVLDERLALDDAERAVVTLLLLRGAQTPGELRSRADRLHQFADLGEVERALHALRDRDEPLVVELDRQPGQKERRWTHLVGGDTGAVAAPVAASPSGVLRDGAEARDERVRSTYDTVASAYAARFLDELDGKPFDRWVLERLAHDAGSGPVADVGCGPGQVGAYIALVGDADVHGFDLSPSMVAEARRAYPELTFEVADLRAVPAAPGGDGWVLVTAWYSLIHLAPTELPDALRALTEQLRTGGRLAFAVHLGAEDSHLDDWFDRPVDVDVRLHDRADVLRAVEAAGLIDVEWYVRSGNPAVETPTERLYVLARRP